ncbi:hypothetical protein TNCV_3175451 [Trichonephila clavipes]|nr:hypothetical protein TNCV_3175451 [Trichonephila clavipes]
MAVESFEDVMEQRDGRIMIKHDFWLGHLQAATVANVSKAWGAGTASERTVLRLFTKFRCSEMESEHKSVVPARVSSTSLDHGSELRGPSPKALV